MPLRNLPTETPRALAALINDRPGQVSSMALAKNPAVGMTLLAFAAGESVSEEEYFGDTLYYLVEGSACVVLPDRSVRVGSGEAFMVPAHVEHAVEGVDDGAFKLLQITVYDAD